MRIPVDPVLRRLIVACLALALMATGLAHRAPAPAQAAIAQLATVLPGVDAADLCLDGQGDGAAHGGDCPACRIAGGADLPARAAAPQDAGLILPARVTAPRESRAIRPVMDPAHGLRAPPLA